MIDQYRKQKRELEEELKRLKAKGMDEKPILLHISHLSALIRAELKKERGRMGIVDPPEVKVGMKSVDFKLKFGF